MEETKTNKTMSCDCAGCNSGAWNKTGIIWFCWRHQIKETEKQP